MDHIYSLHHTTQLAEVQKALTHPTPNLIAVEHRHAVLVEVVVVTVALGDRGLVVLRFVGTVAVVLFARYPYTTCTREPKEEIYKVCSLAFASIFLARRRNEK